MSLKERISEDMKAAMRAKDAPRLSAIRLLLAALKQKEVDQRVVLTDADVTAIIEKLIKQRRDSITQYVAANRQDLADVETFELNLLQGYLPQQMTDAEILSEIELIISETGAVTAKDMGKVMTAMRAKYAGQMDFGKASGIVKGLLG